MARVIGLGHVGIYVRDLERMVAFYRDTLGMRVTKQNCIQRIGQLIRRTNLANLADLRKDFAVVHWIQWILIL